MGKPSTKKKETASTLTPKQKHRMKPISSSAKTKKSKDKNIARIPPPPPPKQEKYEKSDKKKKDKKKEKTSTKKKDENEEQISECPDWINRQICDSFRSCPYFHDGVECDTWVEYGKCPEKDAGKCKEYHHRSIWIQDEKENVVEQPKKTKKPQEKKNTDHGSTKKEKKKKKDKDKESKKDKKVTE